jgi:homoserine O-succinyltransferase
MPIKIPDALPAKTVLESENIFVMPQHRAIHQDIRPLKLLLLNLMPDKVTTETQLLRCLSNTPLQIEITLLQTSSYQPQNTPGEHLLAFYTTFGAVRGARFDGMIITGAPIEQMEFADVDYWGELAEIMDWTRTNVHSTLHICWGAQAALYHHYGIRKHPLPEKMFGVFEHRLTNAQAPLLRGFDERFPAPHSRHTEIREAELCSVPGVELLAASDEAGVFAAIALGGRQVFVTGHPEYDALTLEREYRRDLDKGLPIAAPKHYYPGDDPKNAPLLRWRAHGNLLYTNWLNYYVYQSTPYGFIFD